MIESWWQIESSTFHPQIVLMIQHQKPIRESISFKKNEIHIRDSRDDLCKHYKLNKSDLYKYLVRKESFNIKNKEHIFLWVPEEFILKLTTQQMSLSKDWQRSHLWQTRITRSSLSIFCITHSTAGDDREVVDKEDKRCYTLWAYWIDNDITQNHETQVFMGLLPKSVYKSGCIGE